MVPMVITLARLDTDIICLASWTLYALTMDRVTIKTNHKEGTSDANINYSKRFSLS